MAGVGQVEVLAIPARRKQDLRPQPVIAVGPEHVRLFRDSIIQADAVEADPFRDWGAVVESQSGVVERSESRVPGEHFESRRERYHFGGIRRRG